MSKFKQMMLDNPEVRHEDPEKWFYWSECDRLGIENEDEPDDKCPKCGAELIECGGMVGEDMVYCSAKCGYAWVDNEQAIAMVI